MKKIFETKHWKIFESQLRKETYELGVPQQRWCQGMAGFFFPHLDLLLVPEPAGFKSDETWEIWVFFSAKNAVKLCSKVYEFTTLFLN